MRVWFFFSFSLAHLTSLQHFPVSTFPFMVYFGNALDDMMLEESAVACHLEST